MPVPKLTSENQAQYEQLKARAQEASELSRQAFVEHYATQFLQTPYSGLERDSDSNKLLENSQNIAVNHYESATDPGLNLESQWQDHVQGAKQLLTERLAFTDSREAEVTKRKISEMQDRTSEKLNPDDFKAFIRHENIIDLKRSIRNYNKLKPQLEPLIKKFKNVINERQRIYSENYTPYGGGIKKSQDYLKSIPEYLGRGKNGFVFKVKLKIDGHDKEMVLKIHSSRAIMALEMSALFRAKGITKVPQVLAHSFQDNVYLMDLMPGKSIREWSVYDAIRYKPEHIEELIDIVIELDKRGVHGDSNASNYLYCPESGFSMIDIMPHHRDNRLPTETVRERVFDLIRILTFWSHNKPGEPDSLSDEASWEKYYQTYFPIVINFFEIIQRKYPELLTQRLQNIIKKAKYEDKQYKLDEEKRNSGDLNFRPRQLPFKDRSVSTLIRLCDAREFPSTAPLIKQLESMNLGPGVIGEGYEISLEQFLEEAGEKLDS